MCDRDSAEFLRQQADVSTEMCVCCSAARGAERDLNDTMNAVCRAASDVTLLQLVEPEVSLQKKIICATLFY